MRDRVKNILLLGVLFAFLGVSSIQSQFVIRNEHYGTFRRAMAASDVGDYPRAIGLFQTILKQSPEHIDALTQLGMSYMFSHQNLDSAIILFDKVLEIIPEQDAFDDFGIYIQHAKSRTFRMMNKPELAMPILNQLRDSVSDPELKEDFQLELKQATHAAILLQNPVPLKITSVGEVINSEFDDHSPLVCLTGKRIYFTSRRPVSRERSFPDGQYAEKIFVSEFEDGKWQEPTLVRELYSRHEHISILSLSPDGTQLFLFMNDRYQGRNIYVSHLVNGVWQEPEMLPEPINSEWDETHASLSPDMSTLYFTSNRPGGFGGLDIYKVKKDAAGRWGEPTNLGSTVNTEHDEETPMMHPDGTTLYFASEGHNSMGGFDVFYSQNLTDGNWAKAVNMGAPVNSADDDFFFVPTLDKSQAYFASYRFSGEKARSDIYQVSFDQERKGSLAVIEGYVSDKSNLSGEAVRILVWRESDEQQVGEYRPNRYTGKYMLFLETGDSYRIQEATPDQIREVETIHVPERGSQLEPRQILFVQDLTIVSPLLHIPKIKHEANDLPVLLAEVESLDGGRKEFTVQVLALTRNSAPDQFFFSGADIDQVRAFKGKDGFVRFVTGEFSDQNEAQQFLIKIQQSGKFTDAWIRELPDLEDMSELDWLVYVN